MKIRLLALAAILCSLAALSAQPRSALASLYLPWTVAPKTYCNSGGTVTLNISLPGNANNGSYGVQAGFSVSKDPLNGQNAPNNWIGLNPNYNIDPHNGPFAAVMYVSGLANQPYWPLGGVWNVDVNNSQTASGLGDTWQYVGNFYEVSVPVTVIKFSGANKVAPWKGPGNVSLTADTGPSGICPVASTATHYRITPQGQAGGSWQTYSAPFPLADGVWKVDFYSTNNYGTEGTHSITYYVDGTPPVETVAFSPFAGYQGWFPASTTFTLTASDATSGLKSMSYSIDAGPTVTSAGPTQTGSFGPSGNHTLNWSAIDHAGNVTTGSAAVKIDNTPPVLSAVQCTPLTAYTQQTVTISATATDKESGVASWQIDVSNGKTTTTIGSGTTSPLSASFKSGTVGTYTISLMVTDHVGNATTSSAACSVNVVAPPPPPPPPPAYSPPTATATDVPTLTPSAVVYSVYQARPTLTYTPSPTLTPTFTPTATRTASPTPTQSPTPEPTATVQPSVTLAPSDTPMPTEVATIEPTQRPQPAAFVYEDSNGNGRCDAGEPGVGGQKFAVYAGGQLVGYATSDSSGHLTLPTVDGPITLRYLGIRAVSGQLDYDPQSASPVCVLGLKPEPPPSTLPLLAMAVSTWLWLLPGLLLMRMVGASRLHVLKAFMPFRSKGIDKPWK